MFRNLVERPVLVVCLAVFGLMTGQQMVNPILAPLARELGFSELALGLVLAVGASGVVLASAFWGRRAVAWGHRPVLLVSLLGALAGLLAFALIAQAGLAGAVGGPVLFGLVLLSRGAVFGLAWAATPVTAQAYIADATSGPAERVRGMSRLGAAQGLGLAVGPAVGGLLGGAGLLVPVYAAPAVLAVIAGLVAVALPRPAVRAVRPPRVRVSPLDRRMWPFLVTGFGLYLAITVVLMTVGFLLQDRLHLDARDTGRTTGLVTLAGAALIVLVQVLVVPRLNWPPLRLLRTGAVLMTAGMVVVAVAPGALPLAAGVAVLGAGLGFGMPGAMAGPTLLARPGEQSAVAGLVSASTALTFVLGPLLGDGLYELGPTVPFLVMIVLLAALTGFTFLHSGLRRTAPVPPAPAAADQRSAGRRAGPPVARPAGVPFSRGFRRG
jgi:MFS transporter, DHA1 family, tetracycline resistance protein